MVEGVLVKEMSLVQKEYRMDAFGSELLDVGRDGMEDSGRAGGVAEAESKRELTVEVTPTQGGVVAVGETKSGIGKAMA